MSRENPRQAWLSAGLALMLSIAGIGLAGCSGVVSGNNATNTGGGGGSDTTAPQVAITSPAAGATVSGSVNLTANATDNVAVASVQFKVDGANAGSALTAAPYSYLLNTSSLSNASHSITAVATDAAGNAATSAAVSVTVNNSTPDTTPPTVSVTAPANGASVSGTVSVTANASDNVSVASVQFQLDSANVGSLLTAAPYVFSWNSASASNGSHTLRAIAKDGAGNSTTSASVSVTVSNTTDTTAPTVSITAPANGATVSGTVSVTATASDNVGVASVQFQLDGANVGSLDTTSPYAYSWNTSTASNGSHIVRAIAKDAAGNATTSAGVTVTVSNTADTTAPSTPAGLTASAASSSQINLTWNASTDNVGVTGYNVLRGGTKVGTSTTTSYQDNGLNPSTSYSYTVSAFDAAGNTSSPSSSSSATTFALSGGGGIPTTLGWYQIPNTTIQPLCPSGVPGNTGCAAVINAWNSGVADTKRNRLVFWGGGDRDYAGNEVYALDLNTLRMLRLTNPSGTYPVDSEAYPDGQISSRHTYGGLSYIPTLDKMYVHGGAMWSNGPGDAGQESVGTWLLDFSTLTWSRKDPVNGTPVSKDCCNYQSFSAYDPNTDAVYYVDDGPFWKYVPSTNTQTQLGFANGIGNHVNAVVDPGNKVFLVFGNGAVFQSDLSVSSPTISNITSQTSGCASLYNTNYPGLAYDPVQKKIVAWIGGGSVIVYDAASKTCTTQTFSGGPGAAQGNGTFGRWQYFPALGVFALVNDWAQNAWVLRMTTASGTGGSSGPIISGLNASSITQASATVGWTTDVGSTTQVEYGTTTAYGTLTSLNSSMVTTHSQAVSGLAAGTLYHYRAHSKNSSGVESISGDFAFSTNSTSDTTAPTISITSPANGTTVSGTTLLTANASDNVGVASVQFLVDGTNLGSLILASPYQVNWNTSAVTNGTHTITAVALDGVGNVGTAIGVTVTVSNSGTTSSALQDFQARCAQPAVIVCQGFDDAAGIPRATWPASGALPASDGTSYPKQDTSITASGQGSLRFDIPTPSGSANPDGYWRQLTQASLSAGPTTAQLFGQSSTFYVQFRQRMSAAYISNTWGGSTFFKQDIIAVDSSTCGQQELTTVNGWNRGFPQMYSACGQDGFEPSVGNGDFLLEQGDTSTSGYNCHYQTANNTSTSCFMYPADTWVTYYYKVQIGNWGQANSTIQAWVAVGGQAYKEWINMPNHTLNLDGGTTAPGYNAVYLTPYWTGGYTGASGPATTWYDELIISTQPIAAPNN